MLSCLFPWFVLCALCCVYVVFSHRSSSSSPPLFLRQLPFPLHVTGKGGVSSQVLGLGTPASRHPSNGNEEERERARRGERGGTEGLSTGHSLIPEDLFPLGVVPMFGGRVCVCVCVCHLCVCVCVCVNVCQTSGVTSLARA